GPATPMHERFRNMACEFLNTFPAPDSPSSRSETAGDGALEDPDAIAAALAEGASQIRRLVPSVPELEGAPEAHPSPPFGPEAALLAELEAQIREWDELTRLMPVPAAGEAPPPAETLDAELRELARMRAGWDELLCRLCLLAKQAAVWRSSG